MVDRSSALRSCAFHLSLCCWFVEASACYSLLLSSASTFTIVVLLRCVVCVLFCDYLMCVVPVLFQGCHVCCAVMNYVRCDYWVVFVVFPLLPSSLLRCVFCRGVMLRCFL